MDLLTPNSPGGLPTLSLTTNSSWKRKSIKPIIIILIKQSLKVNFGIPGLTQMTPKSGMESSSNYCCSNSFIYTLRLYEGLWLPSLTCWCASFDTAQVEMPPATIRYWRRHTMTRVASSSSVATLHAHLYDLSHLHLSLLTLPLASKVAVDSFMSVGLCKHAVCHNYMCILIDLHTLCPPHAGSGVVRIYPLRFLAGCRTRQLNQVWFLFYILACFNCIVACIVAPFMYC